MTDHIQCHIQIYIYYYPIPDKRPPPSLASVFEDIDLIISL